MMSYFMLAAVDVHRYLANDLLELVFATLAFKHIFGDECFVQKHMRFTVARATIIFEKLKSAGEFTPPLISTLLYISIGSLLGGIATSLFMVYPVGVLQCDRVSSSAAAASGNVDSTSSTAEKAYMAICLLADGVMDDLLFNVIAVSLIVVGDGNLNASVYVSLVFSSLIITKRVLRSYYDLIAPYHDRIFAVATIVPTRNDDYAVES